MSELPAPPPPPPPAEKEPSRTWFVVLAWITLTGFVLFTGGITVLACRIPELKAAERSAGEAR
jgi:hypothetical protein